MNGAIPKLPMMRLPGISVRTTSQASNIPMAKAKKQAPSEVATEFRRGRKKVRRARGPMSTRSQ